MTKPIVFTKANIDAQPLPESGKRATYHDTHKLAAGLQLRITSNGVKTFCVFRRIGLRPERITIGRYPNTTIEQARRRAAEVSSAIANGANPAEIKRGRKAEPTFGELFHLYLERHAKRSKLTWHNDEQRFRQYLERPLGNKKLTTIKRQSIATIFIDITTAGHPVVANRVIALVSSVYGWALSVDLWESNPVKGIKRNKEQSRDRFLQSHELPRFFQALADEENETVRDYVLLALLTGARRTNVLAMSWGDVNFERAEWRIAMTKNGTPQTVTLSPEALEVLRHRKPEGAAKFVFPGTGRTGHLTEPRKGWVRILDRAESIEIADRLKQAGKFDTDVEILTAAIVHPATTLGKLKEIAKRYGISTDGARLANLRIHDLRRTLGSWQAKTGASLAIIGKSLNHKNQNTTAIYARLDLDPVRDSVNTATSAMLAAAGVKSSTNIMKINPRKA